MGIPYNNGEGYCEASLFAFPCACSLREGVLIADRHAFNSCRETLRGRSPSVSNLAITRTAVVALPRVRAVAMGHHNAVGYRDGPGMRATLTRSHVRVDSDCLAISQRFSQ